MTARQQGRQLNAAFSLRPRSVCAMRAIWMIVLRPVCLLSPRASTCLPPSACQCVCLCVDYSYFKLFAIYCVHFWRCNFDWCAPAVAIVIDCSDLAAVSRHAPAAAVACQRYPISRSEVWLSSAAAYAIQKNILSHSLLFSLSLLPEIATMQQCELKTFATKYPSLSLSFLSLLPLSSLSAFLLSSLFLCIASLTDNGNNKEVFLLRTK